LIRDETNHHVLIRHPGPHIDIMTDTNRQTDRQTDRHTGSVVD